MANKEPYVSLSVQSENSDLLQLIFEAFDVEGIEQLELGMKGFWPLSKWERIETDLIESLHEEDLKSFELKNIPFQNWNAEWESDFQPICVNNFCCIRAPFHTRKPYVTHDIIIEPKMAFGTGHHATTFQMIEQMQMLEFENKKVLDYGTGTGVLAILAEKMKAQSVKAIDNDEMACESTLENSRENGCFKVEVQHQSISDLSSDRKFDVVLANINRNVLLGSVAELTKRASSDATLLMSGFYVKELPEIRKTFENSWEYQLHSEKDRWCCVKFKKMHT